MSLQWDLDAEPVADASVSTPPRKLSSRLFEAGGGGEVGSLSGGAQLTLVRWSDCVHGGGEICAYLRGKDKRTCCLAKNCATVSHKKAEFGPGVESLLVIQTGPEMALSKPTAEPGLFGSGLERYLKEKRSADAWITLLEQTRVHNLSAEEVD
jgi:hypothetical protein